MVLCAIGMHSFAQNVINQTVIVSGDSNNASFSNDDIGGVEFRRIPYDRKKNGTISSMRITTLSLLP